jgi:carboxypeptidase C (cathepsin A)
MKIGSHALNGIFFAVAAIVALSFGPMRAAVCAPLLPGEPVSFVTKHHIQVKGSALNFTVHAGETYLTTDSGERTASIFSYSYIADSPKTSQRPVLFVVGGGPGAASYSLNVGLLGPWTVPPGRLAPSTSGGPSVVPPFKLSENQNSILDVCDLVFIDPVGTGYSRALGETKPQDFWALDQDLDSLAQFIQLWLSKFDRWDSPKFFLGESYGGTRAALIPNILMGGPNYPGLSRAISLNGVIVMSNGLGWPLGADGIGTNLLAATTLPNYAAAAWYHNKIDRKGRSLAQFYDEVTQFATGNFFTALSRDEAQLLSGTERQEVVAKLSEYTGLPAAAFHKSLAIAPTEFSQQILADRGLRVGVYDTRFTLPLTADASDAVADDAALSRLFPVFTGAFLNEESGKLNVHMERPYVAIHFRDLNTTWSYARKNSWMEANEQFKPKHYGTNAEELALAMGRNPSLYAMVVTGYYDLLMTPAAARLTTERAGIPKERLILKFVEGGHEPYVDDVATDLSDSIRAMIRKASH